MRIEHIRDVLPHVEGRSDFVVANKGSYIVVDYLYAGEGTFDHPARIECRGLKFDKDGPILARPFQKFFNLGERAGSRLQDLDFSRPHVVMDKLDGSMIHPAILDGEVVFMTRMGRTDVARACEKLHLTDQFKRSFSLYLAGQCTPILEWTAPQNRIVLPYEESRLTLLAVRNNVSGEYVSRALLPWIAKSLGVHLVREVLINGRPPDLRSARALKGVEGYVAYFAGGTLVKAKADEYVLKHRAKDAVLREKNLLQLIVLDQLDDVLPLLDGSDRSDVEAYRHLVLGGIERTARNVEDTLARSVGLSPKEFALGPAALDGPLRGILFTARQGGDVRAAIRDTIAKNCGSSSAVNHVRQLFGNVCLHANDNIAPLAVRDAA